MPAHDIIHPDLPPSRWAARLRELAPGSASGSPKLPEPASLPKPPEPLRLQPPPRLWQRVQRGVTVPTTAAAAAFVLTIIASIAMVWLQPHSVGAAAFPNEKQTASSGIAAGNDTTEYVAPHEGANAVETESNAATLYVHVVGEVTLPGVYELPADARVLAAIEAAGGATEHAVLSVLNLARPLSDGEQIVVPNAENAAALTAQRTNADSLGVGGGTTTGDGLVNLNTADQAALETLPRVGPALAQRIIEWREANGGFSDIGQLTGVSGIGQRTFEQLQELVTI